MNKSNSAWWALSLLALLATSGTAKCQEGKEEAAKKNLSPGAVEVRLVDDSSVKLLLRDERIELETPYGKLLIPVADIQRIDFGLRIAELVRKKVDAAIGDLSNGDFRRRQAASKDLLVFKEKGYLALVQAAKSSGDQEKKRRIEDLLEKIREAVPADVLEIPPHDIVQTADSRIAGRIKAETLRVGTLAFGEQQVKLADLRSLRSQRYREAPVVADSEAVDPRAIFAFQNQIGKTLLVRVTGPLAMQGMAGVFGTDVYTIDSSVEAAAIHAGAIQPGKAGVIRITIVGPQPGFQPSVRNGIASQAWGPWNGFRIEPPAKGPARKN